MCWQWLINGTFHWLADASREVEACLWNSKEVAGCKWPISGGLCWLANASEEEESCLSNSTPFKPKLQGKNWPITAWQTGHKSVSAIKKWCWSIPKRKSGHSAYGSFTGTSYLSAQPCYARNRKLIVSAEKKSLQQLLEETRQMHLLYLSICRDFHILQSFLNLI